MDTSTSGAGAATGTQTAATTGEAGAPGTATADAPSATLPPSEQALLNAFTAWIRTNPEAEDPSGSIETLQLLFEAAPTLGDLDDQNLPEYSLAAPSSDLVNALIEYAEEGEDELSTSAADSDYADDSPADDRQDGRSQSKRGLDGQKNGHGNSLIIDDTLDAPTNVGLVLDDYFQFLATLDADAPDTAQNYPELQLDGLAEAQDALDFALVQLSGIGDQLLMDAQDESRSTLAQAFDEPPAHVVLRDVGTIKPVAALDRVLAWLGDGRPLAGTGAVTPEDIGTLGGLLGLDDDLRGVTTIWEVPRLAAWWRTLEDSGIITEDETTVRPGTQAKHFVASDPAERAGTRAALVANYLEDVLFTYAYSGKDGNGDGTQETTAKALPVLLAVLTSALVADEDDIDFDAEAVAPAGAALPAGAKKILAQLVSDGILVPADGGAHCSYTIPEGIKHAVADVVSDATEALWEEP